VGIPQCFKNYYAKSASLDNTDDNGQPFSYIFTFAVTIEEQTSHRAAQNIEWLGHDHSPLVSTQEIHAIAGGGQFGGWTPEILGLRVLSFCVPPRGYLEHGEGTECKTVPET